MNDEALGALKITGALLVGALILRHSILGVLLALAASCPAAYATWIGAQEEGQKTYAVALVVFLASLVLTLVLFLLWLF